ncbi:bifunctional (p)ppGpp synthetase/guanosine-3',5'-bis(diphosphate) 3'-pyrophosphohydrolase [Hyphomicrobiales bacterium]|jgi:RelA/SpoT family (p)ppGpp synthetase|nr:bifunctional (p)ppGpp synthetase/guanosine-3',5'-bis(diphosphate) 3'-pyrophosphohydrolase [Hyphomicrobiales bacterium]|tara:strand:- start:5503 stop:7614 length:2112 start_codon:yes stop_codon:yes gene_type:complete
MRQYELIDSVLSYKPESDQEVLKKAYVYGTKMHGRQLRASGDPYFSHPIEVARILAELKLDTTTLVCALLHDTIEDTSATIKDIESNFGSEVAKLVDGVTKLTLLEGNLEGSKQAENFRKLLLASASDIRILLIKLADRLHNMRTLNFIKDQNKRKRISLETLDIYAPLAGRIGMHEIKEELEDLSFSHIEPRIRDIITERLKVSKRKKSKTVVLIEKELNKVFYDNKTECSVTGRLKKPYSVWKKLEIQQKSLDQLSDIFGFRVCVNSISECYNSLGILHGKWQAIPGRFKDYISTPKKNGYQSLHTTLIGPKNQRVEVQIRTHKMNEMCEKGLAAHWAYKDKNDAGNDYLASIEWINDLVDILNRDGATEEFLENTKLELFHDQIYAFTPKGTLVALPRDATALDFAYAVHTDLGNFCSSVKINGADKRRRTKLQNGDEVEIVKSKTPVALESLQEFVKTGKAKSAIIRSLKEKETHNQRLIGKAIIKSIFSSHRKKPTREILERSFGPLGVSSLVKLYGLVGEGLASGSQVYDLVFPNNKRKKRIKNYIEDNISIPVTGLYSDLPAKFSNNSFLVPGDKIVGIIIPKKGITIYYVGSDELLEYENSPESWVKLDWKKEIEFTFIARIIVTLINEVGVLNSITSTIADYGGNISNLILNEKDNDFYNLIIDINVNDNKHINAIVESLDGLPVIESVKRFVG